MATRLVLHVGVMKSGTTFVQRVLLANRDRLAEHGVLFPGKQWRRQVVAVRDLMVHRIEEYARHCGHADLLRECVDGRVGQ